MVDAVFLVRANSDGPSLGGFLVDISLAHKLMGLLLQAVLVYAKPRECSLPYLRQCHDDMARLDLPTCVDAYWSEYNGTDTA